jgi:hypothetical protein
MAEIKERPEPAKDSIGQVIPHEATAQHMRLYDKVDSLCREMFVEKNTQYDNAIVETGVLGAAVEIIGLQRRVRALVLKSTDHGKAEKDALADLLKDLHVYANIALLMLADDNWSGK